MKMITIENVALFIFAMVSAIGWIRKNISAKKEKKELQAVAFGAKTWIFKELYDLQRFSELERYIKIVCAKTNMNRFTIMISMNGKLEFNFITVLFDQKISDLVVGGKSVYEKVATDSKYKSILGRLEWSKFIWDHDLNGYGKMEQYSIAEKIKEHMWGFVGRVSLDKFDDVFVYCSMSSEECCSTKNDKEYIELMLNGKIIPQIKKIISAEKLVN